MDYGNYGGNYQTTSYSGAGNTGGGGFMSGGSQTSPSGGGGRQNDSLRPVTIKQLNEAETQDNTEFKVDSSSVSQLTLVGQVRNISTQTTNITYRIDDGTGTIEVKQWIDSDADESSRAQVSENSYVRVWGRLKSFNNKRHVGAQFIRPITDMNEISYHLLEATAVHLHFTRGPPSGKGALNGAQSNGGAMSGMSGGDLLPPGLSAAARKVHHILRTSPQSNEGLHIHDIASRAQIEIADVNKGADELLGEALIYTTVDDNTWAILDMAKY